jgi:ABC-2 type transport system permease protein
MGRGWLVARHEYRKFVGKRSFLVSTLGFPLFMVLVMGISIFTAVSAGSVASLGYVDQAGILGSQIKPQLEGREGQIEIVAFPNQEAAQESLQQGQIQAFYVLPADYLETRLVDQYYWEESPNEHASTAFSAFVRANLAAELPEATRQRLVEGPSFTSRSMDGRLEIGPENFVNFIFPFVASFLFIFAVMTSAGYLLQVVADEKENRTIEMLVTSLSPEQIIGGKALGLMGVGLTQLLVWVVAIAIGLVIGARFVPELQALRIPWDFVLVVLLFFLPAYALITGFMTAIGGSVAEVRHGQQIAGMFNLLFMLPFFFIALIISNPDSPILVVMTLFPTTAFVTVLMRWGISIVPLWQLISSWVILTGSAVLMIWASARIFRRGMLRYGQSLDLRAAWEAVFPRTE